MKTYCDNLEISLELINSRRDLNGYEAVVQEPWVEDLDFTRMERINTKFYSYSLERRDGDIILRIPFFSQQEIYSDLKPRP